MSDHNNEKQSEKEKLGFWGTALAAIAALIAAKVILPTDEIMKQVVKPGFAAAGSLLNLGKSALVGRPTSWLLGHAGRWLLYGVLVAWISLALIAIGVHRSSGLAVAVGGLFWTAYVLASWIQIRVVGTTLAKLAEAGVNLAGSALGQLLKTVGLTVSPPSGKTLVEAAAVTGIIRKAFRIVAASLALTVVLAVIVQLSTAPAWTAVSIYLFGCFALLAATLIASIEDLKIPTDEGWKLLYRLFVFFGKLAMAAALVVAALPAAWPKLAGSRGAANQWIANPDWGFFRPWVLLVVPVILWIVFKVMAAWHDKGPRAGLYKALGWASICSLPVAAIIMALLGLVTMPDVKASYWRFMNGPTVTYQSNSSVTVGQPVDLPPPSIGGSDSLAERPAAPPEEDPRKVLEDILKE